MLKTATLADERRYRVDRRQRTWYALVRGSIHPRRRGPRRGDDASIAAVDWHDSHWLAVALLILILSCADGFLTLALLEHGAYEANPVMAPLAHGSSVAFAFTKMLLTAAGVVVLTMLARLRAFRRIKVSSVLYALLTGYGLLIAYEIWLLERLMQAG